MSDLVIFRSADEPSRSNDEPLAPAHSYQLSIGLMAK